MHALILLIRVIAAAVMPLSAVVLSWLTIRLARQGSPGVYTADQSCLKCGLSRSGAPGGFAYTRGVDRLRRQMRNKQPALSEPILTETEIHFICDPCAWRYLRQEILFQILIVLPYPVYASVFLFFQNQNQRFPNLLLEVFLIVLAIAGVLAALNLYRALKLGETPLAEIRDRVSIQCRRRVLGKDLSYYTRSGIKNLKK